MSAVLQQDAEAALLDQIDELKEENRQLKDLLLEDIILPPSLGLTMHEHFITQILLKRQAVSYEVLVQSASLRQAGIACVKTLQVHVHSIRKKLKPYGVRIVNQFGIGYFMPPVSKERLRSLCDATRKRAA